ncbi:hypothetical protein BaRGS_00008677 [Batillaria attramentaria]|uniref:Uncharacterized protein n=1 Tax=Batillaria attramentaria TaxID=370345 RepID=A0ABD0LLC8_9CAEN
MRQLCVRRTTCGLGSKTTPISRETESDVFLIATSSSHAREPGDQRQSGLGAERAGPRFVPPKLRRSPKSGERLGPYPSSTLVSCDARSFLIQHQTAAAVKTDLFLTLVPPVTADILQTCVGQSAYVSYVHSHRSPATQLTATSCLPS